MFNILLPGRSAGVDLPFAVTTGEGVKVHRERVAIGPEVLPSHGCVTSNIRTTAIR